MLARKDHYAGRGIVRFNVSTQGEVTDIRLVQGLCSLADEAVRDSARRLKRFKPGMQAGNSVGVAFRLPVSFVTQKLAI
ncbi:energy transducer TonB [Hymenobacter negativus]|uniref:Energy transducer TonB n=1 Tax=Hymenobacter negativus TaxID=2795026 RepID=A0ABS3QJ78_9BACT|nr:energy transducer TonB [Hymenobacter negativus]